MPLNAVGEIEYIDTSKEEIRYQANPPVCNLCKQEITRENVGWIYLDGGGSTHKKVEFIECRGCTMMRVGGTPLRLFLKRHGL
jgi:hypothetical protein